MSGYVNGVAQRPGKQPVRVLPVGPWPDQVWRKGQRQITKRDRELVASIIPLAETPAAIERFAEVCADLSDFSYWHCLGTLWVSYPWRSDLALWERLLRSDRADRDPSLMKPYELRFLRGELTPQSVVWRAHRPGERRWLSYTLDEGTARRMSISRKSTIVAAYSVATADVLALFLRRNEYQCLVLDQGAVTPLGGQVRTPAGWRWDAEARWQND